MRTTTANGGAPEGSKEGGGGYAGWGELQSADKYKVPEVDGWRCDDGGDPAKAHQQPRGPGI